MITNPIDFLKRGKEAGDLAYLNYNNLSNNNQEFQSNHIWDIHFTPALIGYFPGEDILKARLTDVSISFDGGLTQQSANIRGWKINQTYRTFNGISSGTITLNFLDFDDQKISKWLEDWRLAFGDDFNTYAFTKAETTAPVLDVSWRRTDRTEMQRYILFDLQPTDISKGKTRVTSFTKDPSNQGKRSITLSFQNSSILTDDSKLGTNVPLLSSLPTLG